MIEVKDPENGFQYNREEAEREAMRLLVDGVQQAAKKFEDEHAPERLIAEICLMSVNNYFEKAPEGDAKIGRCFVGMLVLLQGLALCGEDEVDFFVECIHEYTAKRAWLLKMQEVGECSCEDCNQEDN